MPFPSIKITGQEPVIGFNVEINLDMPGDGSPIIAAFDVPPWHWTPFQWSAPRRTVSVSAAFPTNSGVYGPNPPVISGMYGKMSGPAVNQYSSAYSIRRVLDPGRYYLVIRPQPSMVVPGRVIVSIV